MATAADSSSPSPFRRPSGSPSHWPHARAGESAAASTAISSSHWHAPDLAPPAESAAVIAGDSNFVGSSVGAATMADLMQQHEGPEPPAGGGGSAGSPSKGKKSVWSKPSNGLIEAGTTPVMDAESWPALSDTVRPSAKSSSSDLLKALSDGSVAPAAAGPAIANPSLKTGPVNSGPNVSANHAAPTRQKSMKRSGVGGGGGTGSGSGSGGSVPPSPSSVLETSRVAEPSPGYLPTKSNGNFDQMSRAGPFSPQAHVGNERHKTFGGNNRRGNNGGGPHFNAYGNRRDQDRGGHDWNSNRNFGGREVHMHHQNHPRPVQRPFSRPPPPPPPVPAPYIASPPVPLRPASIGNLMRFPDPSAQMLYFPAPLSEAYMNVPFVQQLPLYIPQDPERVKLQKQIEYYFSRENLLSDLFLRNKMDQEGWVHVSVIASFKKVEKITTNIQYILETMWDSSLVEVQGDKMRTRGDWMQWIIPPEVASGIMQGTNNLVSQMSSMSLQEGASSQNTLASTSVTPSQSQQ